MPKGSLFFLTSIDRLVSGTQIWGVAGRRLEHAGRGRPMAEYWR